MSDLPAGYRDQLDLRAVIAQIDRNRAESMKLQEEAQKFVSEQHKMMAEAAKLAAEEPKLNRDRWLAPVLAIAAVIGGLLGAASFIAKVVWGP
jgi:hypothetical protein